MTFNFTLYKKEKWRTGVRERIVGAIRDLVKKYTLEELYPPVEVERDGRFFLESSIFPHQLAGHNKITPVSGKQAKYTLINGGVGSGKSLQCSVDVVKYALDYPGIQIVVVTAYDYYIDEFIWPTLDKVLPQDDARLKAVNKKSRIYYFKNGSIIRFKAYDDADKVKGWEAHIIWIEEASELGDGNSGKALAIFNALLMRHRAPGRVYPRLVIISQNPKGHNWCWKLFIKDSAQREAPIRTWIVPPGTDPTRPEGVCYKEYERIAPNGDAYYCVSSGTSANPQLPPGYRSSMLDSMSADKQLLMRMVEGDFNPINALIYDFPLYSEATHVVTIEEVRAFWMLDEMDSFQLTSSGWPRHWRVTVGIDIGGKQSPWAAEVYIQPDEVDGGDGHWLAIAEFYKADQLWSEVARAVLGLVEGFTDVSYFVDPHSGPQHSGPNQTSVMEEFPRYGIPVQIPLAYNKKAGIVHVSEFLKRDPRQRCPYDPLDDADHDTGLHPRGHSMLYYILGNEIDKDSGQRKTLTPMNQKEKGVWRLHQPKVREAKESEEGLSPTPQEKPVDRDDHGQTAEMFAFIGISPIPPKPGVSRRDNAKGAQVRYPGRGLI